MSSTISTDVDGTRVSVQPKVVDAGHHTRRLLRLTGLDVEENQARRLLNDLDSYRAATGRQADDEEIFAHEWLSRVLRAGRAGRASASCAASSSPRRSSTRCCEHRWYISEARGHDIGRAEAVRSYIDEVLVHKPDEAAVLGVDTLSLPVVAEDG